MVLIISYIKKFIAVVFLLLWSVEIFSQEFQLMQYNSDKGLHDILVKDTELDSLGFVWIATDNGLSRFDGISFKVYNRNIPSVYVKDLFITQKKELLAVTDNGIVQIHYNYTGCTIETIISGTNEQNDTSVYFPKSLYQTSDGTLWISGNRDIYNFKNKKLKVYTFPKRAFTSSYNRSYSLLEDARGNLLCFSQQGFVYQYDKQKDVFVELTGIAELPHINQSICVDKNRLWVATSGGLMQLRWNGKSYSSDKPLFENIRFSTLKQDKKGNIFAGSWNSGIYIIKKTEKNTFTLDSLLTYPFKSVTALNFDSNNMLWCSNDGGVVLVYPRFFNNSVTTRAPYIHDIKMSESGKIYTTDGDMIYSIEKTPQGFASKVFYDIVNANSIQAIPWKQGLCISHTGATIEFFEGKNILKIVDISNLGNSAYFACKDLQQNIWFCQENMRGVIKIGSDFKVVAYNRQNKKLDNQLLSLAIDKNGVLYGGASGDSTFLFRYEAKNDTFINVSVPITFEHNKRFEVNDLAFVNDTIYLATTNGLFGLANNKIFRVAMSEGNLLNIKAIANDNNSNLWLGTDIGLIKYNRRYSTLYNESDGMPSNLVSYRCLMLDTANRLWIGTNSGLCFFSGQKNDIETPMPFFKYKKFNDIEYIDNQDVYNGSYANFEFRCCSYPATNISYQTRLLPVDTNWSQVSLIAHLFLPNMRNGEYVLQVRARQHGNYLWSKTAEFRFKVVNIWYQTWWAYILYFLLLFLLVWILMILNTKRLLNEKLKLEAMVNKRTAEIRQQKFEIIEKNEELRQQAEEIEAQRDELSDKNDILTKQKERLANQRDAITESYHNIKHLSEIGKDVTANLTLSTIVDAVYRHLKELMSVDEFGIGIYDKENNLLIFKHYMYQNQPIPEVSITTLNRNRLSVVCVLDKIEIVLGDIVNEHKEYIQDLTNYDQNDLLNSLICLPLIKADETIGFISVQSHVKNAYCENQVDILRSIGAYVSVAMENADAFQQIEMQKSELEKSHREIRDSMQYARRIQNAVLPSADYIEMIVPHHFILFKPCEIVSGDFYFIKQIKSNTIIAAADCTGHGVPGAFMSMLGVALLNEIVIRKDLDAPNKVLDELRSQIKNSLRQTGQMGEQQDGMDIALCIIDIETNVMSYSGANSPLYLFRNGQLIEFEADRMPVGVFLEERPFTNHKIQLMLDDVFYLFSDGYHSQFGGVKNGKYKLSRFKKLLSNIHKLPIKEQKNALENEFNKWKDDEEQVDDVLVVGIKYLSS